MGPGIVPMGQPWVQHWVLHSKEDIEALEEFMELLRTRGNGLELHQRRFRLDVGKRWVNQKGPQTLAQSGGGVPIPGGAPTLIRRAPRSDALVMGPYMVDLEDLNGVFQPNDSPVPWLNPSHPSSDVATPPPTSFLPSFSSSAAAVGLNRGPMGEEMTGDPLEKLNRGDTDATGSPPPPPAEDKAFTLCHGPTLQTKVFQYRIWDVNQKSLYLRADQLVAGHLQGANAALEEKVFWVPNRAFEAARLPVILSIRNGTRCLATVPARRPTLELRDADIREVHGGEESAIFTFFRSHRDGLWRFESAANPGWFLCTSARGHRPLGLSRHHDATHLLDFYFQLC
ncbi:uncharacterized protein LOC104065648 [Cuculus canorus]|uniref:uncharacterized protein LOC104065648 n=1 Tax=Cuculus canorus TaxID=55661 RepID=UPI0023AADBB2|nr:uncharacterized protein LOC104065648 [Cuculus canorus]